MYGDPETRNLCSACFKDSLLRPPFSKPVSVHSAPVQPSARLPRRQKSHSQVLASSSARPDPQQQPQNRAIYVPSNTEAAYGNNVVIGTGENAARVQVGQVPRYLKCATPACANPANPNILEGYCNTCYRAFKEVFVESSERKRPVMAQPTGQPYYESQDPALQQQSGKPYRTHEKPLDLPTPKPTRIPCKHSWCKNYGNPKCLGYCNECYQLNYVNRSGQVPHY